ncbi:hypothetical protein ACIBG8_29760 [Nonomuraea sp. NPDC050556]|uniref:hypothetical protein n=1 Tax=Nonomuraea sp. NPDC050556 TaxID=3364369 RepID=UPI0037B9C0C8
MSSRIYLDAPSTPARFFAGCLTTVVAVFCGFAVAATLLADRADLRQVAVEFALFFVLPVGIVAGLGVLVVRSSKVWLDGHELVRRDLLRTTATDLTEAIDISLESVPDVATTTPGEIPVLVIRDHMGTTFKLRLRNRRGWLPTGQLLALADVIGARTDFRPVADWLRRRAADPEA